MRIVLTNIPHHRDSRSDLHNGSQQSTSSIVHSDSVSGAKLSICGRTTTYTIPNKTCRISSKAAVWTHFTVSPILQPNRVNPSDSRSFPSREGRKTTTYSPKLFPATRRTLSAPSPAKRLLNPTWERTGRNTATRRKRQTPHAKAEAAL